ncbi:MAG: VOC family protein [Actinomyces sp.]|nr:MAG: VOC family protein [Actinomyces sp.]
MVQPIPDDYPRVTPYICVDGAAEALEFYARVFGAVERMRIPGPEGRIGHAEIAIGDAVIMLSDPYPDHGAVDPHTLGGTPVSLNVYVEDADAAVAAAVDAGATLLRPVETHFYGDRGGFVEDPWGHRWSISTHVEDVPPEELARRAAAAG